VKKSDEKTYVCQGVGADGSVQSFTAELKMARKSTTQYILTQ